MTIDPRIVALYELIYVDETDNVWVAEWADQVMLRFDPATEKFETFRSSSALANVRQIHGLSRAISTARAISCLKRKWPPKWRPSWRE